MHVWHSVGRLGGAGGGGCRGGEKRGWDSLLGWPAVCQLCASRTLSGVEKGLLSPTCTHSLSPFTPQTLGPAKSGGQILLKPSLLVTHACGLLLRTPTHTHLSKWRAESYFPFSNPVFAHTDAQKSFHAILHVSLLLTRGTKQVIRAWVKSSIHIVLSVCSQSASPLHSDRTPLTAGRI